MNIDKYLKQIIAVDGSHMKFELEANFHNLDGDGEIECNQCYGVGTTDDGDETFECNACYGAGYVDPFEQVTKYMMDNLPDYITKNMTYGQAYYDSSVNMEYTFTIKTEAVKYVPQIIRTFTDASQGYDTDNAGFHISVLTDKNGRYPCNSDLDIDKLDNFIQNASRLLPAMIYLATPSIKTRKFYFRLPQVSTSKYSAIHILKGGFEFRLFDPCLDEPEKVFDYIKVIAGALKYYSHRKLKSKLYDKFTLDGKLVDYESSLPRVFSDAHNLDALRRTLPYIDPDAVVKIKTKNKRLDSATRNAIRQYQNWLSERQEILEKRIRKDCLEYLRAQKQKEALKDLNKITAQEYINIQNNRAYAPGYLSYKNFESIEQLHQEAIKYNNDDLPARDIEYFKQNNNNRTIITITG
jgi:hypothetical protein